MPGTAIVLAVGDEFQPDVLLHRDDVADRLLLDALEARAVAAGLGLLARLDQGLRPDQAAHMVGAERRKHVFCPSGGFAKVGARSGGKQ